MGMMNTKYFFPVLLLGMAVFSGCNESVVDKETDIPESTETETETIDPLTIQSFAEMPFTLYKSGMDGWVYSEQVNGDGDTLRTEQFSESLFHIINSNYADATIYDSELKVSNGICVGMSKEDFLKTFTDFSEEHSLISVKEHYIEIHSTEDFDTSDRWEFHFHTDTLEFIKFDHYVDADYDFTEPEL
jgi:hypothetical protein